MKLARYTGKVLCGLCMPKVPEAERLTKTKCDGCGGALVQLVHYRELVGGWVPAKANAVVGSVFSGTVLCEGCLLDAERGEQLELGL